MGRTDGQTDGQTDGVTALLDLLSPSATQVKIKSHNNDELTVQFEKTTAETFEKIINKIYIKRATGVDNIPSKMVLKNPRKSVVAPQLTSLINLTIGHDYSRTD